MPAPYCLDWYGGPSAQLEIFSPKTPAAAYQLKYTPALRSTLRPPIEEIALAAGDLQPIVDNFDSIAVAQQNRGGAAARPLPAGELQMLERAGMQLFDLITPRYVSSDFRGKGLFLELGVDEQLLGYPWELLHDGDEFLSLKHFLGRFVNSDRPAIPPQREAWSASIDELRVLVISVPKAAWPNGPAFEPLPEAEAETDEIIAALGALPGVKIELLAGVNATFDNVYTALKTKQYQIVHFTGHAQLNQGSPRSSNLVLFNRGLTTGSIAAFVGQRAPILCFVNACETAAKPKWNEQNDIFGIARAFLETGAYLLGTRSKITDRAGAAFARTFYASLLEEGLPVGQAVTRARVGCKAAIDAGDLSWASYIYYGDPRLWFRRQ